MIESETMQHWKGVKSSDNGELALAMADFATKMERQRDEARKCAESYRNRSQGKLGYCLPSDWLPWERAELEREPIENN